MKDNKPKEKNPIMEKTKKQIILNSIVALLIIISFVGIYVINIKAHDFITSRIWQAVTMLVLGISIVLFEIAYNKDNGLIAITGIEILFYACYILTVEYVTLRFNISFKLYILIVSLVFFIYYILKMIVIYTRGKKNILNSFSDIADIVKEDEPKKKEAVKRRKGEDENND